MIFHDIFDKSAQTSTYGESTHATVTRPMVISAGEERRHSTNQAEASKAALERIEPTPPDDDIDTEHEHTAESDQDGKSSVYSDSGSKKSRRKRFRGISLVQQSSDWAQGEILTHC